MVVGDESEHDARVAASCLARRYLKEDGGVLTADASPENRAWLAARFPGHSLRLAPAAEVEAAILSVHGDSLRREAVEGLARRMPELSAHIVVTKVQGWLLIALGVLLLVLMFVSPAATLSFLVLSLSAAFVASGLFRAALAWIGAGRPDPVHPVPRHGLPCYTILVPMYREAAVLPGLVRALRGLDYPQHLLDIKLVLEADDLETIAVAEQCSGAGFEIIRVPDHGPRTKPKAANYALPFARGEYLVIYDAEDRPEPDQLLKAVAAFRAGSRQLACLQARLNFYNANHNWLTSGLMAQTPRAEIACNA